ncbi:MAG: hypothetical protein ACREN7_06820 [Candidatus Dormibacteria bacterium]
MHEGSLSAWGYDAGSGGSREPPDHASRGRTPGAAALTHVTPLLRRPLGRGIAASVLALLGAALFSGCGAPDNGVSHEKGPKIIQAAGKALASAKSFQVRETLNGSQGSETLTFDAQGSNEGRGTFTAKGLSFEAEELGGVDYFRSPNLWSEVGGSSLQQAIGGGWVYIASDSPTAAELTQAFAGLTNAKGLANQLTAAAKGSKREGRSRVAGQPVVAVAEPKAGTVYVAAQGPAYPLRWDHGAQGTASFGDFGKRFQLQKPKHALSLQALAGG